MTQFKVNLIRGEGFTDSEWLEKQEIVYWWMKCWNDSFFRQSILKYEQEVIISKGIFWVTHITKMYPGFDYTQDPRAMIVNKMMITTELILKKKPHFFNWIKNWSNTQVPIAKSAGLLAHEFMHKLGYYHPFFYYFEHSLSVPIGIQELTEKWILLRYNPLEFRQQI